MTIFPPVIAQIRHNFECNNGMMSGFYRPELPVADVALAASGNRVDSPENYW
jgi:hypothetical protein